MIRVDGIRAVVTDIEGTTSSLDFVREQLFPYARHNLAAYVCDHETELADLRSEIESIACRRQLRAQEMIEILLQWMDEDRKVTALKTLQGLIWRSGYERGELRGHIYDDAVRALRNWHALDIAIYVYSSGSVQAQRLLFAHTAYGNLTPLFSGYFDTTIGSKLDDASYRNIVRSLSLEARSIVFLSDHSGETRAARVAGMHSVLVARGAAPSELAVHSFDEIVLSGC